MPCQFGDAVAIRRLPFPFVALLAAVLAAAFLMSSVPVAAQAPESKTPPPASPVEPTLLEESVLRRIFPEPQSSLLTLSPQLPAGGVPWLRRIPGVAEEMNSLTPFLRDTSLNVHFRTFYFDRLNSNGTTNEAWAFGGWLAYKSGWLADTLAIGAVGYTSQPLYAPDDTPGTGLLHPLQESILVLGQAYGQVRYKDYILVTGGRQIDDEGYLNPNDSRMIPNTFEAVTATGKLGPVGYEVGYFWTMKARDERDFHNMATEAGVKSGENRGLVLTRLSAEPIQGLKLYGANYLVPDVFNTVYGNAEYTHPFTKDFSGQFGVQYTDQRSTGQDLLGNFNTYNFSTRALALWRGLTAGARSRRRATAPPCARPTVRTPATCPSRSATSTGRTRRHGASAQSTTSARGPCSGVFGFPASSPASATPRERTRSTRRPVPDCRGCARVTSTSLGTFPGSRACSSGSATPTSPRAASGCYRDSASSSTMSCRCSERSAPMLRKEKSHDGCSHEFRARRPPVLHRRGAARPLVQAHPRRPDLGRQA